MDQGPGSGPLCSRGSRCTAAVHWTRTANHARTASSARLERGSQGTSRVVRMALLTAQAGVTPCLREDPGTGGTEARQTALVLYKPAMASDHPLSREPAMTHPLVPTKFRWRPAAGGLPRRGAWTRSPGSDQPQSSHVLYATRAVVRWCHQESTAVQTVPVPRSPEGTWRRSLLPCACVKSSPAAQADWRPPARGDEVTTVGCPVTKGTEPETRTDSGTTVPRYGHLRSAPVVAGGDRRTECEPPTLRAALC